MEASNLSRFRVLIETRTQSILDINASSSCDTRVVELDQSKVGRLSRIDAMQMQQMNLESERRRSRELVALGNALSRIENQSYGICTECDEDINPRRLEVDPVAQLCITCASKLEQSG
jgi:DnaK suppressor protein